MSRHTPTYQPFGYSYPEYLNKVNSAK